MPEPIKQKKDAAAEEIFIGRQTILDWNRTVVAYELLFRQSPENQAKISDNLGATAHVINHAFFELGIGDALGNYPGFINASGDLLMSDLVTLLPKDKIVLEVLETVEVTPALVERLQGLHKAGYSIALDDYAGDEKKYADILPLMSIVKIDLPAVPAAQLSDLVAKLRRTGARLLAEKVETQEEFDRCCKLGFDLFQGYFFSRPVVISGKRLNPSETMLLHLLGLIMKDAETVELEAAFKQEPGLSINLMRMTNAAASGSVKKITSLRDAIVRLGRNQLQRWLQLVLFTNPKTGSATPLLQAAATRGRFMELAAETLLPQSRGAESMSQSAFMVGIMSLMPHLLGLPMNEVLASLPVSNEIRDALEKREGDLGGLLDLTEALETSPADDLTYSPQIEAALQRLPKAQSAEINSLQMQAMGWAHAINV